MQTQKKTTLERSKQCAVYSWGFNGDGTKGPKTIQILSYRVFDSTRLAPRSCSGFSSSVRPNTLCAVAARKWTKMRCWPTAATSRICWITCQLDHFLRSFLVFAAQWHQAVMLSWEGDEGPGSFCEYASRAVEEEFRQHDVEISTWLKADFFSSDEDIQRWLKIFRERGRSMLYFVVCYYPSVLQVFLAACPYFLSLAFCVQTPLGNSRPFKIKQNNRFVCEFLWVHPMKIRAWIRTQWKRTHPAHLNKLMVCSLQQAHWPNSGHSAQRQNNLQNSLSAAVLFISLNRFKETWESKKRLTNFCDGPFFWWSLFSENLLQRGCVSCRNKTWLIPSLPG